MAYEPLLPPWNWNPAATFQTAYIAAQENQRAQERFALEQEIERELFPLKVQTAQMQLEKLIQDRDRTMLLNEQIREGRRNASAGINSALSGGSNAPANNQPGNYGPFGSRPATPPPAQQTRKNTIGSDLTPI